MANPYSKFAEILNDFWNAKFSDVKKYVESSLSSWRIGPEQLKPGAIIQPKLSTGIKQTISNTQTDIEDAKDRLDSAEGRLTDAEGNISAVQSTASQLTSDMTNAQGDISTLVQRADGFDTAVSNINGDISTIHQNADSLALVVGGKLDADDPASGIVTSGLSITQDGTLISIPPTGSFGIEINGEEEGQVAMYLNKDGTYIPDFSSPTVAPRAPGGVFTVGASTDDYASIDDAFDDLEGAVLRDDVFLLLANVTHPGGVLRGVRGGRAVNICPRNLLALKNRIPLNATYSYGSGGVVTITAASAGTFRAIRFVAGNVGDLGLAGKKLTFKADAISASGGAVAQMDVYLVDADYTSHSQSIMYTTTTNAVTFMVPEGSEDRYIVIDLLVNGSTAVAAGASVSYTTPHLCVGEVDLGWQYPGQYTVSGLDIRGCDRVNVGYVKLPAGMTVRDSDVVLYCSQIYGAVGVLADMARVRMADNAGTCTHAVKSICSQVQVTGNAPSGTYDGLWGDTTDAIIAGGGSAPTETTNTLTSNSTGTYSSYWWSGDRDIRQGYTTSNGRLRGGMWWDFSSIPAGATVTKMQLTLKRLSGYGKGDYVTIKAYGTASNARSGQPALTSGPYVLGEINNGQTRTFELPAALVAGLTAGTYKGIALYANDTSTMSGKTYSTNYCRIDGTDGTAPKLAVTYSI